MKDYSRFTIHYRIMDNLTVKLTDYVLLCDLFSQDYNFLPKET